MIASRRELLTLADKGLSCNDTNSKNLIEYLDSFIAINDIPVVKMVDRLGDVKGDFIHPLVTEIHINPNDEGERQILEAFKVKGTVQSWINDVFNLIRDQPKAFFPIVASFASVLLHEFNMTPIVVDIGGGTSTGKSTVQLLCASVWGSPNEYIEAFNTTLVGVERRSTFLNSYPLILDDTKAIEDESLIQPIIYQFVNNAGKLRGSLKGGQHVATWRSIMVTSGENGILEYTNSHGSAARVIPITNFSFDNVDDYLFGKIYYAYPENHGVIGLEFLERWKGKRSIYLGAFEKYRLKYLQKSPDNDVSRRISHHYAFIVFVGKILNDLFYAEGLKVDLESLDNLFDEITRENKAVDRPLIELERLLEEIDSQRHHVYADEKPKHAIHAIEKDGELYFTIKYVRQMLGVNAKQIRTAWMKRGITFAFQEKKSEVDSKVIYKNDKSFRGILVNKEYIEKLGFDFSSNNY